MSEEINVKAVDIREHFDELPPEIADAIREKMAQITEATPELVQSMGKIRLQFGLLGAAIGTAVGALTAFYVAYRKAESKYSQIADDEIEEMRKHFQNKTKAAEGMAQKGAVEALVSAERYVTPKEKPPMAVQPPESVTTSDNAEEDEEESSEVRNVFRDTPVEDTWDYQAEKKRRSPDTPYVIHYDERHEMEYQEVTLTYYESDDVLCNERDEIYDLERRDKVLGEPNLGKFGHGSNDISIVYIRNDELELVFEVVKSPNSYAEEVHGFGHDVGYHGNLERMRARERDEQED